MVALYLEKLHACICRARFTILTHAKTVLRHLSDEIDEIVTSCDEGGLLAPAYEEGDLVVVDPEGCEAYHPQSPPPVPPPPWSNPSPPPPPNPPA